jgi:hypothetical protein
MEKKGKENGRKKHQGQGILNMHDSAIAIRRGMMLTQSRFLSVITRIIPP